ncbi:glycosyltransferase family 2 protein [Oxyplasma meridianum]|uniref:Glycosyltransferase family 2 protein n=1 Tax=Oxyplasma meridianum TaxID=3073602 RepID=A0AAX4NFZ2_9ARCH
MDITVIVTAFNRKEYLDNAIRSLENQTFKDFETILITNFDFGINKYKIKIKHIKLTENEMKNYGEYLSNIVSIAKGKIISFLEDDDLFYDNKLEFIYNLFKNNKDLVYYHNRSIFVDKNYKEIKKSNNNPDFNMSSITIKKSIINNDYLKQIKISPDTFMYSSALESKKKIIIGKEILTKFMSHKSTSHIVENDFNIYIKKRIELTETFNNEYKKFLQFFKSKKARNHIKALIFTHSLMLYSFNKNNKPYYFSNFLFYNKGSKIFPIFEYISLLIFGNYARKILNSQRQKINAKLS